MNPIDKLKAAYDAALPGEWTACVDVGHTSKVISIVKNGTKETVYFPALAMPNDAEFIAIVHNMTPAMMEAVKASSELMRLNHSQGVEPHEYESAEERMDAALTRVTKEL